jgi:hypothetical protein
MTIQTTSDLNEMGRRRLRANEANKVGLWILLGAVAAALVAGAIYATSYLGTQTALIAPTETTGSANSSAPTMVPLPLPRPANL